MEPLFQIISKPDNVPIVMLFFLLIFYSWYGLRQAFRNDRLENPLEADDNERIFVWPYLVRMEFVGAIVIMAILTVWSIVLDAPLEEPANPANTPNPSKAPWYFLGLQEMLVYFDPWIAGVIMPSLIIVGLMAIPYLDINKKGNGYYSFKDRKLAMYIFLFGFYFWMALIFIGTFLRGPGWNIFWPWEYWDPHRVVSLANVDLPYLLGFRSYWAQFSVGLFFVGGYLSLPVLLHIYWIKKGNEFLKKMGPLRFYVFMILLLSMSGIIIKMLLRWSFNIKYILVTPWFNI